MKRLNSFQYLVPSTTQFTCSHAQLRSNRFTLVNGTKWISNLDQRVRLRPAITLISQMSKNGCPYMRESATPISAA